MSSSSHFSSMPLHFCKVLTDLFDELRIAQVECYLHLTWFPSPPLSLLLYISESYCYHVDATHTFYNVNNLSGSPGRPCNSQRTIIYTPYKSFEEEPKEGGSTMGNWNSSLWPSCSSGGFTSKPLLDIKVVSILHILKENTKTTKNTKKLLMLIPLLPSLMIKIQMGTETCGHAASGLWASRGLFFSGNGSKEWGMDNDPENIFVSLL